MDGPRFWRDPLARIAEPGLRRADSDVVAVDERDVAPADLDDGAFGRKSCRFEIDDTDQHRSPVRLRLAKPSLLTKPRRRARGVWRMSQAGSIRCSPGRPGRTRQVLRPCNALGRMQGRNPAHRALGQGAFDRCEATPRPAGVASATGHLLPHAAQQSRGRLDQSSSRSENRRRY